MTFQLDNVVPWGRSFAEYQAMFALTEADLQGRILGCGDGPASFNCELTERGGSVVSIDPIYEYRERQIAARVEACFGKVIEETRKNADEFVWSHIGSVEELADMRMAAMRRFLADYENGRNQGRYHPGALPSLPFAADAFDLGLCSHFLFLYSQHFDLNFHLDSIAEMCRVCREVRIFPLLQLGGERSPYVRLACDSLAERGLRAKVEEVPYEFQRGGNQMLQVSRLKLDAGES
jgi:hypothetical protein